jgi:hypothetical protein
MFNEPGRANTGPWECPYCGTSFNAPLMICPQCGAKQRAAAPRMSTANEFTAPEWHDGFARHAHAHAQSQWNPAPAGAGFGFAGAEPSFSGAEHHFSDYPSRDEAPVGRRSWVPFYAVGGLVSVAFLLTAYVISHRQERDAAHTAQIAEGSILGANDKWAAPIAKPPAAHSAPPAVASVPPPKPAPVPLPPPAVAQAQPPAVAQAQPPAVASAPPLRHVTVAPPVVAHVDTTQQNVAARNKAAEERSAALAKANAAKASANGRADVNRELAIARGSLDKNNLGPARKAIVSALAQQPSNGYALQMQTELVTREQERDSLLGYARLCAREGQWVCAWHNAGHALTVDASSSDARELLSRSIAAQQGAGTARQVYGGPPGPPVDDQ